MLNKLFILALLVTGLSKAAEIRVEASSTINSAKYPAKAVIDNDVKTAWCAKESTPSLDLWFHEDTSLKQLTITNGYQKNSTVFAANARGASVAVTIYDIFGEEIGTATTELKSRFGKSDTVKLPEVQSAPIGRLHLKLTSTVAGKKYTDICISEVQLTGDPKPKKTADKVNSSPQATKGIETLRSKNAFEDFPKLIHALNEIAKTENSDGAKLFFEKLKKPSDGMETSLTQLALLHFMAANPPFVLIAYQRASGSPSTLYDLLFDEAGAISKDSVILLLKKVEKGDESFEMANALKSRLLNELTKE